MANRPEVHPAPRDAKMAAPGVRMTVHDLIIGSQGKGSEGEPISGVMIVDMSRVNDQDPEVYP